MPTFVHSGTPFATINTVLKAFPLGAFCTALNGAFKHVKMTINIVISTRYIAVKYWLAHATLGRREPWED